jgi:glycosyltransferase involved in cell wall biosynthesis
VRERRPFDGRVGRGFQGIRGHIILALFRVTNAFDYRGRHQCRRYRELSCIGIDHNKTAVSDRPANEIMINGKRIAVVLPAYNAEKTLAATVAELAEVVDIRILVDDHSSDRTIEEAKRLGLTVFVHDKNYGYGRNQQTCYSEALAEGADVVVMLHPDYQYTPLLLTAMASMVAYEVYDVVLGSRIIGGRALRGGMPFYKYVANRFLTAFENLFLGIKLSEYHTGYRAFSREVLTKLPLLENSDDFVFDNQMLAQCAYFGFRIGEVSCPTKYFEEASSINFSRSVKYGFGVLATTLQFALQRAGIAHYRIFSSEGRKLEPGQATYYARGAAGTSSGKI